MEKLRPWCGQPLDRGQSRTVHSHSSGRSILPLVDCSTHLLSIFRRISNSSGCCGYVIIRELYELNCIRVSLMQFLPMMLYWLRRLVIASFCWRLSLVAHGSCANYTRMRWPLLARKLNRTFSSLSRAV